MGNLIVQNWSVYSAEATGRPEFGGRKGAVKIVKMTPEEFVEEIKNCLENSSTQKMLSEIRTMLSQFIQDERTRRRERTWR